MRFPVFHLTLAIFAVTIASSLAFLLGVFLMLDEPKTIIKIAIPEVRREATGPTFSYAFAADTVYKNAYIGFDDVASEKAPSAIVAHHLLVADEIAEVFATVADEKTRTVVLISPNHFDQGQSALQTSLGSWQGPFGVVSSDVDAIENLQKQVESLTVEEETFEREHGISAVAPFVVKSFPNARLVPIVIHDSATAVQVQELASAIERKLSDAVVIASVDMSHNLPSAAQAFHDDITLRTIRQGSFGTESSLDLETDSNAALKLLYAVNALRGDQQWHETYHGSSLGVNVTNDWEENTSHILGYFTKGHTAREPFAALHVVGDVMLDRGVRLKLNEFGIGYPWQHMQRFLRGTHSVVGNLEGTVNEQASTYTYDPPFRFVFSPESVEEMGRYIDVVSLANNHTSDAGSAGQQETKDRLDEMGIDWFGSYATPVPRHDEDVNGVPLTYIGYHQFQPALEELKTQIAEADLDGRFVIVYPHWGNEYIAAPQQNQRALAQIMVDAGADLIIGGHPHVAQGIEVIDDVLVVYSLGNFIFDQQIPQTWQSLTVGVIVEKETVRLYVMPVYTKDGQPVPLGDAESATLLEGLAELSSESLQSSITTGIITIPYEK